MSQLLEMAEKLEMGTDRVKGNRCRGLIAFCTVVSFVGSAQAQIQADVIYGHKDGMALVYDVFVPAAGNGAGVIYMVSGGWFSRWQDPAQRVQMFQPLTEAGFTVFAVHHGSAPRFKVPDAVSDVRSAVRHIHSSAADYGVDPTRLGVWGGSAGGHLSLMLGLDPEGQPASAGGDGQVRAIGPSYTAAADTDARLAAVVAYFPPVDLRPRVGPSERFPALDFPRDEAAAISPILFVSPEDPPTLLVHGDADDLVPLADSEVLAAEFDRIGVTYDLLVIEGGDHGFRNPVHRAEATAAMVGWFKTYLASVAVAD